MFCLRTKLRPANVLPVFAVRVTPVLNITIAKIKEGPRENINIAARRAPM